MKLEALDSFMTTGFRIVCIPVSNVLTLTSMPSGIRMLFLLMITIRNIQRSWRRIWCWPSSFFLVSVVPKNSVSGIYWRNLEKQRAMQILFLVSSFDINKLHLLIFIVSRLLFHSLLFSCDHCKLWTNFLPTSVSLKFLCFVTILRCVGFALCYECLFFICMIYVL